MKLGALEAGGTKMVCAIGTEKGKVLDEQVFPTKTPAETIPQIIGYFQKNEIEGLGIAAFGPVDVVLESETYGKILNTPKRAWQGYDILAAFKQALSVPIGLDTDVNAACLGEAVYGAAKGLENVVYLTVGTGIGAGIYSGHALLHGMLHPEAGHILIPKHPSDTGKSVCPFHENCAEGLASGPSIEKRWGKSAKELADFAPAWELEGEYLAAALVNYILILSPQRIILGGGVMKQEQLFPIVRKKVLEKLNHYYDTKELRSMENYIVPAGLGGRQGVIGALCLAAAACDCN